MQAHMYACMAQVEIAQTPALALEAEAEAAAKGLPTSPAGGVSSPLVASLARSGGLLGSGAAAVCG